MLILYAVSNLRWVREDYIYSSTVLLCTIQTELQLDLKTSVGTTWLQGLGQLLGKEALRSDSLQFLFVQSYRSKDIFCPHRLNGRADNRVGAEIRGVIPDSLTNVF